MIDPCSWLLGAVLAVEPPSPVETEGPSPPVASPDLAGTPTSALPTGWSVEVAATWTSAYVFRGYVFEDHGFIFQPAVTVGWAFAEESASSPSAGLYFLNWNSVHGAETDASRSPASWFETDLVIGANVGWQDWTFDAAMAWYLSPSDAFDTIVELDLLVSRDLPDDTWFGTLLGDPYALLAVELDNQNRGANHSGNTYLELGAGPSFALTESVGLEVPVALGLGLHDYYLDDDGDSELFGFVSITPTISWTIARGDLGELVLDAGVSVQFLGEAARATNDGDDTNVVGFVGVGWSF